MAEDWAQSFPPLLPAAPRILILGSMPGQASLAAQQYYAHPRNAFWPILCTCLGVAPGLAYPERVAAALAHGIAIWDVLSSCRRPGSLDSAIEAADARGNDIGALLATHPGIRRVLCNGASAGRWYRRYRWPREPLIEVLTLPSTSPAHAGMPFAEKLRRWRSALG